MSGLVLALVVALGVAAAIDGLRGGAGIPETHAARALPHLRGPDVPGSGILQGRLYLATADTCRLRSVGLATLTIGRLGPATSCGLWVSPGGGTAVTSRARLSRSLARELALVRLSDPPKLERRLGFALGDVSWSRDGRRIAWCTNSRHTTVVALVGGRAESVRGCDPVFASDGSVLTSSGDLLAPELLRGGRVLLDHSDLARAFPPRDRGPVLDIIGYDENAGRIAVVVLQLAHNSVRTVLEVWRERQPELTVELVRIDVGMLEDVGSFGPSREIVQFSPSGDEIAVAPDDLGTHLRLIRLPSGTPVLGPLPQQGFAWSPDGTWFALSTGSQVLLYGRARTDPAYALPLSASTLAWR